MKHTKIADVLFITLTISLILWAIDLGWEPLSVWMSYMQTAPGGGDAAGVVSSAQKVSLTGDIYTIDPPFRYVGLASIYYLMDASGLLAEKIGNLYTSLHSFVLIPLSLYLLFRSIGDSWTGCLTVGCFAFWRVFDIGVIAYYDGVWQYSHTIPLFILGLFGAHKVVTDSSHAIQYTVLTGVFIGIIGLLQYVYAIYIIISITLWAFWQKRISELLIIGTTGGIFALVLAVAPKGPVEYALGAGPSRIGASEWRLELVRAGMVDLFTTPAYLLIIGMFLTIVALTAYTKTPISDSYVVEFAVIVLGVFWTAAIILYKPDWFAQLAHMPLQYLLMGALVQQTLVLARDEGSAVIIKNIRESDNYES
jgi:hypothetical protein